MLDGVHSQHFFGTGVIIHHSENMGLVAVDKNTVAISASDIMISFAAFPIEIPGEVIIMLFAMILTLTAFQLLFLTNLALWLRINKNFLLCVIQVVFLHPVHNYALVAYDPSLLGQAGAAVVRAAELLPGECAIRLIASPFCPLGRVA